MFSTTSSSSGMPARRLAAAAALGVTGALVLGAAPAQATGGDGSSGAVVLRTGLEVALLNRTVQLPLNASLNEVHAPASADRTALAVHLDGVEQGRPVNVLRAEAATARATSDAHTARAHADLLHAKVHLPGLPLLSLIEVQKVTSEAVCEAGRRPTATSNLLGSVTVLGKKVTLSTGGTTRVEVPSVGEVRLDLSKTATTSRTAAATALELNVSVNPLKLNVAEVRGRVTLAEAHCAAPSAPGKGSGKGAGVSRTSAKSQPAAEKQDLAETGGSSATPYIAAAAGLLVVGGGGALLLARRRRG